MEEIPGVERIPRVAEISGLVEIPGWEELAGAGKISGWEGMPELEATAGVAVPASNVAPEAKADVEAAEMAASHGPG